MEYIPVKTRALIPPHDDLFSVMEESLTDVRDGDVILVTSKVVSIHHGRSIPIEGTDKKALVEKEAEGVAYVSYREKPLTVVHHALISSSGIDESNSNGYYTLLPQKPYEDAKMIWEYVRAKHGIKNLGVIITDSHSLPFRYGAMSVSIGFFGIEPIERHKGRKDIFGRLLEFSVTNIIDALAAGSTLVAGECDERHPIIIARAVPNLIFTEEERKSRFLVDLKDDIYRALFEIFTFK